MRKALFFLILLTGLASCTGREVMVRLSGIESYINERPDSALAAIRDIDTTALRGKAVKAKYSLLHAMALDKNYIDTADTRIVQPAVEYYSRHGSPEERLKAYMYLGTEQYNGGKYNNAIISFYKAAELAPKETDLNILGILYSRMANTFTRTQDYLLADDYIDKSIECFRGCGRKDQENLERIIKAQNLVLLNDLERADSVFNSYLIDSSFTAVQKGIIDGYYAIMILSSPDYDDSLAYNYFSQALASPAGLQDYDQFCAYAYLLGSSGNVEKADSLFLVAQKALGHDNYSVNYWRHRLHKKTGDYKGAYKLLLSAKYYSDSVARANMTVSAANAQKVFLENQEIQKNLIIENQRKTLVAYTLFILALIALFSTLLAFNKKKHVEEQGRISLIIDSLNEQIRVISEDYNYQKQRLGELTRENTKARFSYLASLYEIVYHYDKGSDKPSSDKLYQLINDRIKVLRKDPNAQANFENDLNKESDNIMEKFRSDFPDIPENETRFASYVFAGFDNTTVMLIMGIPNLEYTRVKKNRLKKRIQESNARFRDLYLFFFNNSAS